MSDMEAVMSKLKSIKADVESTKVELGTMGGRIEQLEEIGRVIRQAKKM